MNDSKRIWIWVGVVVVLVAIAFAWWPSQKKQPSGPTPVFAPQGQLTPNFPKQLMLDPAAQVGQSYAINYDPNTNQYTAQWTSSSSVATVYNDYQTYFGANGWTITNQSGAKAASKIAAMYAATSTANVNVTIVAQGKGAAVTVSYVGH